jgi:MFS family permease
MAEQSPDIPEPRPPTLAEDAGRVAASRKGRLVFIVLALVLYAEIAPMQLSAVSSILPKLAPSFPSAGPAITWATIIVGVAGGATMALLGKLGDKIGKRNVTLLCGALFLAGCLLCVLTSSWPLFLVGRALGGASWALTALEYGLVRDLLPRRWIPVAVGVLGTGFGVGGVVTPIIVGALTDHYSWRSVFWFMIIYTVVTTPLLIACVPESPLRLKARLDIPGAVLFGASLGTALVYVSEGSSWGWANMGCLAYLIVGAVLFAAWIWWERRTPEPMMDLKLLRAPKVSFLMAIAFLITLMLTAVSTMIFYMFETPKSSVLEGGILAGIAAKEHAPAALVAKAITFRGDISYANGMSILSIALHITLWTALFMMIFGVIGGILARRVGCRTLMIISGAAAVVSSLIWVFYHSTWQEQVLVGVLYGLAAGLYYAANPNLLMDTISADVQGVGAGMLAVWGAVGTAVAGAVFTAVVAAHPFTFAANDLGHVIVTTVPQVYTNSGYSWAYVATGVVPGVLALLLAAALKTGRSAARGGAPATPGTVTEAALTD